MWEEWAQYKGDTWNQIISISQFEIVFGSDSWSVWSSERLNQHNTTMRIFASQWLTQTLSYKQIKDTVLHYLTPFEDKDIFHIHCCWYILQLNWSEEGRHNSVRIKDQHLHFKEVAKNRYWGAVEQWGGSMMTLLLTWKMIAIKCIPSFAIKWFVADFCPFIKVLNGQNKSCYPKTSFNECFADFIWCLLYMDKLFGFTFYFLD